MSSGERCHGARAAGRSAARRRVYSFLPDRHRTQMAHWASCQQQNPRLSGRDDLVALPALPRRQSSAAAAAITGGSRDFDLTVDDE
jgi:hypothetical protein